MTTATQLKGLTIAEIRSQYPNGTYKSSMKKADIIAAALATTKPVKEAQSQSPSREPAYGRG